MGSSTAEWLIENRVIRVVNRGKLTANDFRLVDQDILALMDQATTSESIHVAVDCLELESLPGLNELEGGRILNYLFDPRCGWTVVIDQRSNFLLKILSRLLTSVAKKNLTLAKTEREALNFLKAADPTVAADVQQVLA
jgi:hypothetical protein